MSWKKKRGGWLEKGKRQVLVLLAFKTAASWFFFFLKKKNNLTSIQAKRNYNNKKDGKQIQA
jgi:hypothetical protein